MVRDINYGVLLGPVVTEKSTLLAKSDCHTFLVSLFADKKTIKKAVESFFSVKVVSVNLLNRVPKSKRYKGVVGSTVRTKRAFVTLEPGSVVEFV